MAAPAWDHAAGPACGQASDASTPQQLTCVLHLSGWLQGEEGRKHNPQFMDQVRQAFPNPSEARLCVACGGGTRCTSAATAIAEAGYR